MKYPKTRIHAQLYDGDKCTPEEIAEQHLIDVHPDTFTFALSDNADKLDIDVWAGHDIFEYAGIVDIEPYPHASLRSIVAEYIRDSGNDLVGLYDANAIAHLRSIIEAGIADGISGMKPGHARPDGIIEPDAE